jgi:hypothetical protein
MPKQGLSAAALGKHLDLSKQRVAQLAAEGVLTKLGDGSYEVDACRLAYIRWLRADDRRSSRILAASKVQDARAEEIALRVEGRKQSHVIEAQQAAVAVIDEFAGQLRADLMAIPARVTADLALRQKIEGQIDEAFGAAGERAAAAASLVEPPRTVVGSEGEGQPARLGKAKQNIPAKRRRTRAA